MVFGSILEAIGHTPVVELSRLSPRPGVRILAKLEGQNPSGSVKDRIALEMIEDAERQGILRPGQAILEPSSGNTGISLALVARIKGYPVKIVMPDNASVERRQILELLGAEIDLSDGRYGSNGSIDRAWELTKTGDYYMPYQYGLLPSSPSKVISFKVCAIWATVLYHPYLTSISWMVRSSATASTPFVPNEPSR